MQVVYGILFVYRGSENDLDIMYYYELGVLIYVDAKYKENEHDEIEFTFSLFFFILLENKTSLESSCWPHTH